jgi:hypothetical protein
VTGVAPVRRPPRGAFALNVKEPDMPTGAASWLVWMVKAEPG